MRPFVNNSGSYKEFSGYQFPGSAPSADASVLVVNMDGTSSFVSPNGTGNYVKTTSAALVTPDIGVATGTSLSVVSGGVSITYNSGSNAAQLSLTNTNTTTGSTLVSMTDGVETATITKFPSSSTTTNYANLVQFNNTSGNTNWNFKNGHLLVGPSTTAITSSPIAAVEVQSTTGHQLALEYNATNYATLGMDGSGNFTLDITTTALGGNYFVFNKLVTFNTHVTVEGVTSIGATGTGKFVFDTSAALTGTPTAPTATGGTNTTQIATTAFVTSAVTTSVTGMLNYKGSTDCSGNPNYPSAVKGDSYLVSVAGKIGGSSGTVVDVGDWYVADANNAGGTEASVGTSWGHMEHNLVGALLASNNLSDIASASTARTNLGLGTLATQSGTFSGTSSGTNTGDQTNISGNAATVTTNANLTGPITSSGNATSIASQTGTGTKFVVDTSPTLVTPTIGAATATSVNKVAITAPATSATLTLANSSTLVTVGAFSTTLTATAATTLTLPTTGTLADRLWVQSRGMNLVTNGYGIYSSDYNFSTLTFDQVNVASGLGSFKCSTHQSQNFSDEFIPVDTARNYLLTVWVNSTTLSTDNVAYIGTVSYDIDNGQIQPYMYSKVSGSTDTTLAAQLNPGDTTVSLTNGTGWYNGATYQFRQFVWYPYANAKGYTYQDYTYTRNFSGNYSSNYSGGGGTWSAAGVSGNTVTLRVPWAGPIIAAGTKVRNSSDGSTYQYCAIAGVAISNVWTKTTGIIGGVSTGQIVNNLFPPGTAQVKIVLLANYPGSGTGNVMNFSAISFTEVTAENILIAQPHDSSLDSTTFQQTLANDGTVLWNVDTTNKKLTAKNQLLCAGTGLGYTTGAGGTVTQATNKSTGVTLSKASGQITMNNAALAGGASVGFVVTNTLVSGAGGDTISVNIQSGNTVDSYNVQVDAVGSGSYRISVQNKSSGSLSEALVLNVNLSKGATS